MSLGDHNFDRNRAFRGLQDLVNARYARYALIDSNVRLIEIMRDENNLVGISRLRSDMRMMVERGWWCDRPADFALPRAPQ
jgi:hypothetical protein